MKGKLHKMVSGYILSLNGDIDDPYAIVNKELAEDYGWYKLSLKNCQAVERGYDLDEMAKIEYPICEVWNDEEALIRELAFKKGFQKALELMGNKKFSEEDMRKAIEITRKGSMQEQHNGYGMPTGSIFVLDNLSFDEFIQSQQQTEWDVEFEMEYVGECNGNNDNGCFQDSPGHNCGCFERKPKLDDEGCLILKKYKNG